MQQLREQIAGISHVSGNDWVSNIVSGLLQVYLPRKWGWLASLLIEGFMSDVFPT